MQTLSWNYIVEKWKHVGFQKYFKNMSWMFLAKIGSMAVSLLATIYIARHLGPTNYGELSYAVSFVSIFSFIAVLGIDQVLYRDLIQYPEKRNLYMGSALGLRLGASILAIILCSTFALWFSPKDVSLFLIFLLSISFIFNSFNIISNEFQANVQSKYPSLLSLYVTIILNILKILVLVFGKGVIYLAFVLLLESIFYAVGLLYYRTKLYKMISEWSFSKEVAKKILHDSWPLIFSSAFALIYSRIDQIMIKNMMDAKSVGLYDAAVRLSEVWYLVPNIIVSSMFPAIINAKKISEEIYYRRIKKLGLILLILSIIIAIPTTLLAELIIKIIFGPAFIGAVLILQIYIWSNISTSLNMLANYYLVAENYKKTLFFSSFLGMSINVILNIFLIPKYGMAGAAFATFISYSIPFAFIFTTSKIKKILCY
ncbi:MAG: flippase [Candidatus Paceibacterota bacterium]|jgi:O-antigen/teichoic acid export membrane protein